MKTIAIGFINPSYEHKNNFLNVHFEARQIGGQIRYYEVCNGKDVKCLSLELINWMISTKRIIKKNSASFITVVKRNKKKYVEKYKELIKNSDK